MSELIKTYIYNNNRNIKANILEKVETAENIRFISGDKIMCEKIFILNVETADSVMDINKIDENRAEDLVKVTVGFNVNVRFYSYENSDDSQSYYDTAAKLLADIFIKNESFESIGVVENIQIKNNSNVKPVYSNELHSVRYGMSLSPEDKEFKNKSQKCHEGENSCDKCKGVFRIDVMQIGDGVGKDDEYLRCPYCSHSIFIRTSGIPKINM